MITRRFVPLALLLGLSLPASGQEVTLKVHHFLPPTAPAHVKFIVPWCEKIEKDSKARLKCQIYPAMQLGGNAPQLYDQARDGVVDIVWTVTGYTPGRFTKTEVFELPFMMFDPQATARAMWEYVTTHSADEFQDVKLLAMHPHGPGVFHNTKRPIKTLRDLRGLKLRAPTRLTNKMIAVFGATPVGMPMPQVPEALSKGVIDGALMPWEVVPAMKVQELVKYHSETDPLQPAIYTTVFAFVMNQARYDSLPPDLKRVIDANSGVELSATVGKTFDEADAQGRKSAANNRINRIPAAEIEKWKKAARPVVDGWIREVRERDADGTALLEAAHELIAKHSRRR